jgi:hypothetical protein
MNPWDTPEGQACFERWIAEATRLFNAYNGSPEFSARKPWSFNKYGILEGSPYGPHSVHAPDDFPFFSNNKYWWMWAHYTASGFDSWHDPVWDGAGIPHLHEYVTKCLSTKSSGH